VSIDAWGGEVPADDPRLFGGDIVIPGNGEGVVDTRRAVLADYVHTCVLEGDSRPDERSVGLLLEGRINRSEDRARVLFLLGGDAVADLITELLRVSLRASRPELVSDVLDQLAERWRDLHA